MMAVLRRYRRDAGGATSVEFGLVGGLFIVMMLGAAEFALAYWQWNAAAKAVQVGARLAAVSDPVDNTLKSITGLDVADPGDPMPAYDDIVCRGAEEACNGDTDRYDSAAMEAIVYGPGNAGCAQDSQGYPTMCRIFPRIGTENVVVSYVHTGLGFAGRPGGPVPTITVELRDVEYDWILLNRLFDADRILMPGFKTSVTGEDLTFNW